VIALLAGADWAITMGDDCVEQWVDGAEEIYASFGHPLKNYKRCGSTFEFCSTVFSNTVCFPTDGTKTLYRLIEQKTITAELLAQFFQEMRNCPKLDEMFDVVKMVMSSTDNDGSRDEETFSEAASPAAASSEIPANLDSGFEGHAFELFCI
jgi:hypothetical protein